MREVFIREQVECFNKVDGKNYKIMEVTDGCGKAYVLNDDGSIGEDFVMITPKNCLAFRQLKNPAPYPIPTGYTVSNGVLFKDLKPVCEQGQIYVKEILAAANGMLVLAVKARGKKDFVDLFIYEPHRDRFSKMFASEFPELSLVHLEPERIILAYCQVEPKETKDSDGKQEIQNIFQSAGILVIQQESNDKITKNRYPLDVPIVKEDIVILSHDGETEIFVPSDQWVEVDGTVTTATERKWFNIQNYYEEVEEFWMDGKISVSWSPAYHTTVVKNDKELRIKANDLCIKSSYITMLDGYDTLIDMTREDCSYRLTFSNKDYQFRTLVSKSTRDRGYIVTVE